MELELHSAQEEAQQQERNIQNISDVVSSKEAEVMDGRMDKWMDGWNDRMV